MSRIMTNYQVTGIKDMVYRGYPVEEPSFIDRLVVSINNNINGQTRAPGEHPTRRRTTSSLASSALHICRASVRIMPINGGVLKRWISDNTSQMV